jgi:O-antigen/teichoic acid export membrane protein
VAVALFPIALRILFPEQDFGESWLPFAILMAGIALASIRLPFFQFLLMAGRPGAHSLYMLAVVAVNVVANAALIPGLGIRGAALGTALSFLGSVLLLNLWARLATGVRL